MTQYTPPTTADLAKLKDQLGYTGEQMAALAGVAGGQQWRKYTAAQNPHAGPAYVVFMAARLALSPQELAKVTAKMREMGCEVEDL